MDPYHFPACNVGLEALASWLNLRSLNEKVRDPNGDFVTELGDLVADPKPTAEEKMMIDAAMSEMDEAVRSFVMSLSPYMRCIVVRAFWFGQTPQQIADELGRKRPAIYNALSRILGLGRKYFSEHQLA